MLAVVQPAPSGLRLAKKGSAYLRFVKFRGSFDVVHFRYGPSVHLPQLPTPPRGDALEVVFRREQPNSTDGTCTHAQASFPGAGFAASCKKSYSSHASAFNFAANSGSFFCNRICSVKFQNFFRNGLHISNPSPLLGLLGLLGEGGARCLLAVRWHSVRRDIKGP